MPSSVVFAALVLAWLVVLVPVVARRRQMVPQAADVDLSARVLPRTAGASLIEEVPVATAQTDGRAGGERAAMSRAGGTALAERADETQEALDAELDLDAERDDLDDPEDEVADRALADEPTRVVGRERVLRRPPHEERPEPEDLEYDEDEYFEDGHFEDDLEDVDDLEDLDDEPSRELRTYRPGRGGFDPDAAEVAARARYTFRQRIALGLIAVAVLSALAALVVSSAMWWLHAVADVLLIGYLVFLRRQTRIEEEVRARRAARLSGERRALEARRERQAAHEARMAAYRDTDWIDGEYDAHDDVLDDDEVDEDDDRDEAPRWAAPRTPPPPVPHDMELVDDTDDDPAFHDLDGERTYGYRRAAGA